MFKRALCAAVIFSLSTLTAQCEYIKFKGLVKSDVKIGDKEYKYERKVDRIEDMPAALSGAADQYTEVSKELARQLTEVPPPGKVKLGDIDPSLKPYEGKKDTDFLLQAKNPEGEKIEFTYVRLGVQSYDQFFKDTTELYALTWQVQQVIYRTKNLVTSVLGEKSGSLSALVRQALKKKVSGQKAQHQNQLEQSVTMITLLAKSAQALVNRVQQLAASGQQLIAAAPASITNPKTVIHMDLIIKGLKQSIALVTESGKLLGGLLTQLAGF